MTIPSPSLDPTLPGDVTLSPRIWLPLGILALAPLDQLLLPDAALTPWLAGLIGLFALFLLLQAALLRLRFCADALLVLRRDQEIRRFPYVEWRDWRIFWSPLPLLFYFRESSSPHLLPMLFDSVELRRQLEQRLPLSIAAPS